MADQQDIFADFLQTPAAPPTSNQTSNGMELVDKYAEKYGVDPSLARAMAHQESGGKQSAVSPKGAIGIMQLMPATAKMLKVDPNNPEENVSGGMRHLANLLARYDGDHARALAAYHAGQGAVDKANGIPDTHDGLTSTRDYVNSILGRMGKTPGASQELFADFLNTPAAPQAAPDPITEMANQALAAQGLSVAKPAAATSMPPEDLVAGLDKGEEKSDLSEIQTSIPVDVGVRAYRAPAPDRGAVAEKLKDSGLMGFVAGFIPFRRMFTGEEGGWQQMQTSRIGRELGQVELPGGKKVGEVAPHIPLFGGEGVEFASGGNYTMDQKAEQRRLQGLKEGLTISNGIESVLAGAGESVVKFFTSPTNLVFMAGAMAQAEKMAAESMGKNLNPKTAELASDFMQTALKLGFTKDVVEGGVSKLVQSYNHFEKGDPRSGLEALAGSIIDLKFAKDLGHSLAQEPAMAQARRNLNETAERTHGKIWSQLTPGEKKQAAWEIMKPDSANPTVSYQHMVQLGLEPASDEAHQQFLNTARSNDYAVSGTMQMLNFRKAAEAAQRQAVEERNAGFVKAAIDAGLSEADAREGLAKLQTVEVGENGEGGEKGMTPDDFPEQIRPAAQVIFDAAHRERIAPDVAAADQTIADWQQRNEGKIGVQYLEAPPATPPAEGEWHQDRSLIPSPRVPIIRPPMTREERVQERSEAATEESVQALEAERARAEQDAIEQQKWTEYRRAKAEEIAAAHATKVTDRRRVPPLEGEARLESKPVLEPLPGAETITPPVVEKPVEAVNPPAAKPATFEEVSDEFNAAMERGDETLASGLMKEMVRMQRAAQRARERSPEPPAPEIPPTVANHEATEPVPEPSSAQPGGIKYRVSDESGKELEDKLNAFFDNPDTLFQSDRKVPPVPAKALDMMTQYGIFVYERGTQDYAKWSAVIKEKIPKAEPYLKMIFNAVKEVMTEDAATQQEIAKATAPTPDQIAATAARQAKMEDAARHLAKQVEQSKTPEEYDAKAAQAQEAQRVADELARRAAEQKRQAELAKEKSEVQPMGERVPFLQGNKTQVFIPGSDTPIDAFYAVVNLKDTTPSNDPFTWEKNDNAFQSRNAYGEDRAVQQKIIDRGEKPEYAKIINTNPDQVNGPSTIRADGLVAGGNQRDIIEKRLYRGGRGEAYRAYLVEHASEFGIDPAQIPEVSNDYWPAIKRVMVDSPITREEMFRIGDDLNRDPTGSYSEAERDVASARKLDQTSFEYVANWLQETVRRDPKTGKPLDASIRDLMRAQNDHIKDLMMKVGLIPRDKLSRYVDPEGNLTEDAKLLFEGAVWGKVFDDASLRARAERAAPRILSKLEATLAMWARLKARGDAWDISDYGQEALRLHVRAASVNTAFGDWKKEVRNWNADADNKDAQVPTTDSLIDWYLHPERYKLTTPGLDFGEGTVREAEKVDAITEALAKELEDSTDSIKKDLSRYADAAEKGDVKDQGGFSFAEPPKPLDEFNQIFGKPNGVEVAPEQWGQTKPIEPPLAPAPVETKPVAASLPPPDITQAAAQPITETIRESDATIQAQLEALQQGRRQAVLVYPDQQVATPAGMARTSTPVGDFIHPQEIGAQAIRQKVSDGTWHELMRLVEPKSAATTHAVISRDAETGSENQTALVSPANVERQKKSLLEQFPGSKTETVGVDGLAPVLQERLQPTPLTSEQDRVVQRHIAGAKLTGKEYEILGSIPMDALPIEFFHPETRPTIEYYRAHPGVEEALSGKQGPDAARKAFESLPPEIGNSPNFNGFSEAQIDDFVRKLSPAAVQRLAEERGSSPDRNELAFALKRDRRSVASLAVGLASDGGAEDVPLRSAQAADAIEENKPLVKGSTQQLPAGPEVIDGKPLPKNVTNAIQLLKGALGKSETLFNLAGDGNAGIRAAILSELTGEKVPKSKAGINALEKALYKAIGIEEDTAAGKESAFWDAIRNPEAKPVLEAPPAAKSAEPLHRFTNEEDGVESQVHKLQDGRYSVVLRDTDAGENLDSMNIFRDEQQAIDHARKIVGVEAKSNSPEIPDGSPTGKESLQVPAPKRQTKAERAYAEQMQQVAEHFTPGNVIHGNYWDSYDKVLNFYPNGLDGKSGWIVRVIHSDKDGNPLPGERERLHATMPDKRDKVVLEGPKQQLESTPPESKPETPLEPAPPEQAGSNRHAAKTPEEAVRGSLNTMSGSEARWEKLKASGASDQELREAIAYEFGDQGGFLSAVGMTEYKGGKNPSVTMRYSGTTEKTTVTGKALVDMVRSMMEIPQKGEAKPSESPFYLFNSKTKEVVPLSMDRENMRNMEISPDEAVFTQQGNGWQLQRHGGKGMFIHGSAETALTDYLKRGETKTAAPETKAAESETPSTGTELRDLAERLGITPVPKTIEELKAVIDAAQGAGVKPKPAPKQTPEQKEVAGLARVREQMAQAFPNTTEMQRAAVAALWKMRAKAKGQTLDQWIDENIEGFQFGGQSGPESLLQADHAKTPLPKEVEGYAKDAGMIPLGLQDFRTIGADIQLAYFQDPKTGSSLAMPLKDAMDREKVLAKLESFRKEFEADQEKTIAKRANTLYQSVFHGSPYRFDKFTTDHIGKGEGAQAFGWGLYFAGNKEVAEYYHRSFVDGHRRKPPLLDGQEINKETHPALWRAARDLQPANNIEQEIKSLREHADFVRKTYGDATAHSYESRADALEKYKDRLTFAKGQVYEADIPEDGSFLHWDKPLSEQPEAVRNATEASWSELNKERQANGMRAATGADLYQHLREEAAAKIDREDSGKSADQEASKTLHSLGIAGIKYLDGSSRGKGEGSHNYVVFDDNAVKILNTFYQSDQTGPEGAKGSVDFSDGKALVRGFESGDISTLAHETGHIFRRDLTPEELAEANRIWDVKDGKWTIENEERFGRDFERYTYDGEVPDPKAKPLFEKFRGWLKGIYQTLIGTPLEQNLSQEQKDFFHQMLGMKAESKTQTEKPAQDSITARREAGDTQPVAEKPAAQPAPQSAKPAAPIPEDIDSRIAEFEKRLQERAQKGEGGGTILESAPAPKPASKSLLWTPDDWEVDHTPAGGSRADTATNQRGAAANAPAQPQVSGGTGRGAEGRPGPGRAEPHAESGRGVDPTAGGGRGPTSAPAQANPPFADAPAVKRAPGTPAAKTAEGAKASVLKSVTDLTMAAPRRERGRPIYSEESWRTRISELGLPEDMPVPTRSLRPELRAKLMDGQAEVADFLLSGLDQHDGVVLASATGTGKAYLGAAIMQNESPEYGLMVTKNGKLVKDWIKIATEHFGMKVKEMPSDMSNLEPGIYVTTHRRMTDNIEAMTAREWNLAFVDESAEARRWQDSAQGAALLRLNDAASKVIYSSATPFHIPTEVGYMSKLGLWDGTTFGKWGHQLGVRVDPESGRLVSRPAPRKMAKLRSQLLERGQYTNWDKNMAGFEAHFGMVPMDGQVREGIGNILRAFGMAEDYFVRHNKGGMIRAVRGNQATFLKNYLERSRLDKAISIAKDAEEKGWKVIFFSENKREVPKIYNFLKQADESPEVDGRISELMPKLPGVVEELQKAFGEDLANFSGSHSAAREGELDAFLDGRKKHLFATYGAGGVGVSLHDLEGDSPRLAIYLGLPWSGVMFDQAIGRPWRFGTKSDVHGIFLASDAPSEMQLLVGKIGPRLTSLRAGVSGIASQGDPVVQALRSIDGALDYDQGGAHRVASENEWKVPYRKGAVQNWDEINIAHSSEAIGPDKGIKMPHSAVELEEQESPLMAGVNGPAPKKGDGQILYQTATPPPDLKTRMRLAVEAKKAADAAKMKAPPPAAESKRGNGKPPAPPADVVSAEAPPPDEGPVPPLTARSPIEKLTAAIKTQPVPPKAPLSERIKIAENVAEAGAKTKDLYQRSLLGMKAASVAMIDAWKTVGRGDNYDTATRRWSGADNESALNIKRFVDQIKVRVPDKLRQEAISRYVEATNPKFKGKTPEEVLREWADKSDEKLKPVYEAAMDLSKEEKQIAQDYIGYSKEIGALAQQYGILKDLRDGYVRHIWSDVPKALRRLQAEQSWNSLITTPGFSKKRTFETYFDGEQEGYRSKNTAIGDLVAGYERSLREAVAARAYIQDLHGGVADITGPHEKQWRDAQGEDAPKVGRPLVIESWAKAKTLPSKDEAGPGVRFIEANLKPSEDYGDYIRIDHPSLANWYVVARDGAGQPIFTQTDLLVHPDYYRKIKNNLSPSAIRNFELVAAGHSFKPGAAALKVSQEVKHTILSLAGFHQVTLGLHALEHRTLPVGMPELDLAQKDQRGLVYGGLMVAHYDKMEQFGEGVSGGGLVSRIPVIGRAQTAYNQQLFENFLPRLKMAAALNMLERNRSRYKDLSDEQQYALASDQANASFGGLNYRVLGRNKTLQDIMQLTLMAPDFLEARGRYVAQAFKPYGREQLTSLVGGAMAIYTIARVLNQLLDDDPHWDHPFELVYNGKVYAFRTIQEDLFNAITSPARFMRNRLSPAAGFAAQAVTGRDEYGRKKDTYELLFNVLKHSGPIPLQSMMRGDNESKEEAAAGAILRMVGINFRAESAGQQGSGAASGQKFLEPVPGLRQHQFLERPPR